MGLVVKWILVAAALMLPSVSAEGVIGAVSSRAPVAAAMTAATAPNSGGGEPLCAACAAGCRTISGLFTRPQMPPGYSLVAQVPRGACRVVVAQLKETRNYIALRYLNGTYILNGDPRDLGRIQEVEAAGTKFSYTRRLSSPLPEAVTARGPLATPVDIMMLYNQPNPGIKYEYMLPVEQSVDHIAPPSLLEPRPPVDAAPVEPRRLDKPLTTLSQGDDARPLRRRRRRFAWKISGMTSCSRTCGGGVQYPILLCVREHNQAAVLERRCSGLERPRNHTARCNTQPCPAVWSGAWSACSATCGPGEQTRVLECMQEISATLTMRVKDAVCLEPRPATTRRCELAPCEPRDNELEQELPTNAHWNTGPWTQCTTTCGAGQRTRLVTCSGQCRSDLRPPHLEPCHGPPCPLTPAPPITPSLTPSTPLTAAPQADTSSSPSRWLNTEWSEHCSHGCGTGTQSRWVLCPPGVDCDPRNKPDTSRACSSDKQCGGRWFTGPWGACAEGCGAAAKQSREVLCVVHVRGQARIVSDMTCPAHEKPVTEKTCEGSCPPRWFTGEWSPCEGHCPHGVQRREVRCLEYDGRYSSGCTQDMPTLKRSCHCTSGLSTKTDYTSRESSQAQDEPSPDTRGCVDQFTNCALVVQARLCQYPYYKTSCCISCRRGQQEPRE